jgi:hypothetical protein
MRHAFYPALVASLLSLFSMQQAAAQVYQCVDAGGKKVFSQTPCAAQSGKDQKLIMPAPGAAATAAPTTAADGTPVIAQQGVLYGNGGAAARPRIGPPKTLRPTHGQPQPGSHPAVARAKACLGPWADCARETTRHRPPTSRSLPIAKPTAAPAAAAPARSLNAGWSSASFRRPNASNSKRCGSPPATGAGRSL